MADIERMRAALVAARARIQDDRESFHLCSVYPSDGFMEHGDLAFLAEYDALLAQIDAALAQEAQADA